LTTQKDKTTISDLAKLTRLPIGQLKKILSAAGIEVESDAMILSEKARSVILGHLNPPKSRIKLGLKKKDAPSTVSSPLHTGSKIISLDKKFRSKTASAAPAKPKPPVETAPKAKALSVEEVLASRAASATKKPTAPASPQPKSNSPLSEDPPKKVKLPSSMSIEDLSKIISKQATDIVKVFFDLGEMVTVNQIITFEQAEIALDAFNITAELESNTQKTTSSSSSLDDEDDQATDLKPRAPIVTIMGHVDHGKTSLLDYIRKSEVAAKEAGGITQHIGAYQVKTGHGLVTFLDTPGHEAFTSMRSRGAQITDIAVIVVAANDGVMPQTVEAIQHAKAADVPIIVAVNKMDKEDADPEKIRTELSKHDVITEEWGGDVIFQNISAKTGQNISALLDSISLQAEMMELKANVLGRAKGRIVEARLDKGLGPTATILVSSGVFKKGDIVLAGEQFGRIRTMRDATGTQKKLASPSEPVEITGLSGTPKAGDQVINLVNEKQARELALSRQDESRKNQAQRHAAALTESLFQKKGDSDIIPFIIKADVHGSLEALNDSVSKCKKEDPPVNTQIVSSNVGGITCSDIHLAKASSATILAFNVRADSAAKKLQISENVAIHYFSIIYDVLDFVNDCIEGKAKPKVVEVIHGSAFVKEVFRSSKFGTISGCEVEDGIMKRNALARVIRDQKVIFQGKIESLRRFSETANEVKSGLECGIGIKGYSDIKVQDVIEAYSLEDNH
tara:strand:+ start:9201 stop:11408 length:2208 start_codon:yes stop_codon:yes gene_type:complete